MPTDVIDADAVEALLAGIRDRHGRLGSAVNAAGELGPRPAHHER